MFDKVTAYNTIVPNVLVHPVYHAGLVVNTGVAGDLTICRISRTHGSVRGGDELFLLCSSIKKGSKCASFNHGAVTFNVQITVTAAVEFCSTVCP